MPNGKNQIASGKWVYLNKKREWSTRLAIVTID